MRLSRADDPFPTASDDELLAWSRELTGDGAGRHRRREPLRARPTNHLDTDELLAEIAHRARAAHRP